MYHEKVDVLALCGIQMKGKERVIQFGSDQKNVCQVLVDGERRMTLLISHEVQPCVLECKV